TIVIRGAVKGIVKAHSISLLATAHVEGELQYDELTVTPGAHLEARCIPAAA
ncbi:MAG: polymer-forming cytoskeletal protein, partial [Rhodospirillaceae bacterium]|nr:polymer-forming cytoskeletal protein [Rhodospirillaceae bacterium]